MGDEHFQAFHSGDSDCMKPTPAEGQIRQINEWRHHLDWITHQYNDFLTQMGEEYAYLEGAVSAIGLFKLSANRARRSGRAVQQRSAATDYAERNHDERHQVGRPAVRTERDRVADFWGIRVIYG
ncbi:hypothetical protein [Micromonospora qiuiae]|nr:hypothetical protein [Micromonospora qiuiae]